MLSLGSGCLWLALGVALYGIGASLYGAGAGGRAWVDSGRRAVYATAGVVVVAFGVLEAAFLRSDFALSVVADHSSTTTPTFYRATAVWSSQEGSLLLWVLLLGAVVEPDAVPDAPPRARGRALRGGRAARLRGLLPVAARVPREPVRPRADRGAEGAGLNPLLRHPSMMIHPPMLYSGYTLFAVPFAFAVGALITRRLDAEWIRLTRPFTLAAWFFLGCGILLGARWSYTELGWGGYWAWDPVENASLMPWLIGTAFLHSVMIQEKRGMLKIWNVSLVLATGVLAILGTFLVRSGILNSIHAFGASTLGIPFLILICGLIAGSVALVLSRASDLRSEQHLDSLLSREAVFLLNNLVLVGPLLRDLLGHVLPADLRGGDGQRGVGRPAVVRPLHRAAVAAAGAAVGDRAGDRVAPRDGREPAPQPRPPGGRRASAMVGVLLLAGVTGSVSALLMFGLAAFVVAAVGQELWRGVRARRAMSSDSVPRAVVSLVQRNRRRYGGYLVHVGVSVLFAGVAASSAFQDARDVQLQVGPDRQGRRLRADLPEADGHAAGGRATGGSRRSTSAR